MIATSLLVFKAVSHDICHLEVDSSDVCNQARSVTESLWAFLAHQIFQFPVDRLYVDIKMRFRVCYIFAFTTWEFILYQMWIPQVFFEIGPLGKSLITQITWKIFYFFVDRFLSIADFLKQYLCSMQTTKGILYHVPLNLNPIRTEPSPTLQEWWIALKTA